MGTRQPAIADVYQTLRYLSSFAASLVLMTEKKKVYLGFDAYCLLCAPGDVGINSPDHTLMDYQLSRPRTMRLILIKERIHVE